MTIQKRNLRLTLLIAFLFLVLLLPKECLAAKSYDWKDIRTPLEIVGGYKMKKGKLTLAVHIPSEYLDNENSLPIFIDYTGFHSQRYKFLLRVNNAGIDYQVSKKMHISSKHLKPGINIFKFCVWDDYALEEYRSTNITIREIGLLKPASDDANLVAKYHSSPKKNQMCSFITAVTVPRTPTQTRLILYRLTVIRP